MPQRVPRQRRFGNICQGRHRVLKNFEFAFLRGGGLFSGTPLFRGLG
nr:MAG TPA: hypothetical protein [Caudoviricetes sp.]